MRKILIMILPIIFVMIFGCAFVWADTTAILTKVSNQEGKYQLTYAGTTDASDQMIAVRVIKGLLSEAQADPAGYFAEKIADDDNVIGAAQATVDSSGSFTVTVGVQKYDSGIVYIGGESEFLPGGSTPSLLYQQITGCPAETEARMTTRNTASITWSSVAGADSYDIYRSEQEDSEGTLIGGISADALAGGFTDAGISGGKWYYYRIRAKISDERALEGDLSDHAVLQTPPFLPAAVITVAAGSHTYKQAKISWKAVAGATGYEIYRSKRKSSGYSLIKKVSRGGAGSYTDSTLTTGVKYYYRVRAICKYDGQTILGTYSKAKYITPKLAASKIITLNPGKKKMTLKWKKSDGASGYEIYSSLKKTKGFKRIKTIPKGKTVTCTIKKLKSKKTYYFKIRAYRTVNGKRVYSAYSPVKSKKAK